MQERGILWNKLSVPSLSNGRVSAWHASSVPTAPARPSPMISVIVPAHNEENYLGATLDALGQPDHGWFEVIVIANGCTDATAKVAGGRCNRLVLLSQKGLGRARNLGARMACGKLLMFLDADTVLQSGALRCIAQAFNGSYAAGT